MTTTVRTTTSTQPTSTQPGPSTSRPPSGAPSAAPNGSAAALLEPIVRAVMHDGAPIRFELWDGSGFGPTDAPGTMHITTPNAIRRLLWAPGQLGLARAYVAGEIDVTGDLYGTLNALKNATPSNVRFGGQAVAALGRAAVKLGLLDRPPAPPPEEAHQRGWRHSLRRDKQAISHHYDVGNEFYEIVLGPAMTYSCARFVDPLMTLADAQAAKHELICRKLGLHERPGARLLDVGCGWGSMVIHAAKHHGAHAVGITISEEQAKYAQQRTVDEGVADRVEIRLQDYRTLAGESFDVISSVGMFEHVGAARTAEYFSTLYELLGPEGRLLNHAISSIGGSKITSRSFIGRYVFPDGELLDVGDTVLAMERAGFEVRDVESLREHYALTLRAWVANLESRWDDAVALVGPGRARVWRLYMAASAIGFEDGGTSIHQVLGVKPDAHGRSGMPATRTGWG